MATVTTNSSLPGPWDLAREAWELFLNRFWSLVKVFGLNVVLGVGALLVGGIVGGAIFFAFGGKMTPVLGVVLGILLVVLVVVFMYISLWMQAAYLLALTGTKETIKMKEVLKKARPFILPLFLTSLLTSFLVMGGFFLFLIPGLLLSIWFSQQQYIVVFEKKSTFLALHTSREYFRGRFFPVFWRMIAVYLPVILLGILISPSSQQDSPSALNSLFQLISFIAQPLYLAYGVVLYKHLGKTIDQEISTVPSSARNQYLFIAGAGYLLLILGILFLLPR